MDNKLILPPQDSNEYIRSYFKRYNEDLEAYICLSPFLKRDECTKALLWKDIVRALDFKNISYLHKILLESPSFEGIFGEKYKSDCIKFKDYLNDNKIDEPYLGDFPDIYERYFVESFQMFNYTKICFSDAWGLERIGESNVDEVLNLLDKDKNIIVGSSFVHSYFSKDQKVSYTSPSDSYFCILSASEEYISKIIDKYCFEGFFADKHTTCIW